GANGTGKTTFIKLLTKEIEPDGGKVIVGDTVVFGHYTQDNKGLNDNHRVIDAIREIADYIPLAKGKKMTAETLLETFLFPRPQQQVYISQLSGGEKRRLHLLRILIKNPNFLILDEPTNDLDILTLNVLEDFLSNYKGCLLVTSHDRYFMDKMVDHLFVLEGNGELKDFNGTYSEYKKSKRANSNSITLSEPKPAPAPIQKEEKRKLSYAEKKELENLEKDIEKMEKRKGVISNLFLDGDLSNDKITELSIEMGEIEKSIAEKEDRWLELSELA
ncbi:MAG: ABC-F family ATP-binding cassette domain-containing protein, partial [Saprospiraceae bacterium]|nr:ABC-F family ATP-binding cassette domain-containing protein [Saprospiraceae bacterium]